LAAPAPQHTHEHEGGCREERDHAEQRDLVPRPVDARALARLFAMIAGLGELDGVRLLSEERVRNFATPRGKHSRDQVLPSAPPVGTMGFWVGGQPWTGLRPGIVMSPGAGGVLAWADLETGVSRAVLHDRMFGPPSPPDQHPLKPIGDAIANLGVAAAR